ncbi:hypothetical protein MK805_13830 [Shimazuella sp. AN120528]|uniref:hypothetical protein n=1 Tax=Shimazuella soli TaxID=1892854 RepID=UPI001F0D13DA|nr:hypothetical protein [Shimazuella soli]MCH5586019.1 hypothetical protein [Shimazuella soli]
MTSSAWITGGPFLEVSFLLKLEDNREKMARKVIHKLMQLPYEVELADQNLEELLQKFVKGYLDDENSVTVHECRLSLNITIARRRKSYFYIQQLFDDTIMCDFVFYGSVWDDKLFDQIGVREDEHPAFISFLEDLYQTYDFLVGGIAYEDDMTSLFDCQEIWPHPNYQYENMRWMKIPTSFLHVIHPYS